MYWDNYDKIHTAFRLVVGGLAQATPQGTRYYARLRIARTDVSTRLAETVDYYYQQEGWFGRSAALAYRDNGPTGSNVYLGGSSDPIHISNSDNTRFSPSITLLDNSG